MKQSIQKPVVLITGANGFIGTYIVQKLLQKKDMLILAMVRGKNDSDAKIRLKRAWWEYPDLIGGLNQGQVRILILYLAKKVDENHGLERFSFLSTAYVAGKRKGDILENDLTSSRGFSSNYEKSKFEAEKEVIKSQISFSIFRPGMVVGDSKTGMIKTFNTVYVPLRLYLTGKLRVFPISPDSKINLVPVDYIGQSVVNLTFNEKARNLTFHLTAPTESLPTVKELVEYTHRWAKDKLGINLPKPLFIPLPSSLTEKVLKFMFTGNIHDKPQINSNSSFKNKNNEKTEQSNINTSKKNKGFDKSVLGILAPYIQENRRFSRENTNQLSGDYPHTWKNFIDNILDYAVYMGFFHRSERT